MPAGPASLEGEATGRGRLFVGASLDRELEAGEIPTIAKSVVGTGTTIEIEVVGPRTSIVLLHLRP